jgi:hypothetical protein
LKIPAQGESPKNLFRLDQKAALKNFSQTGTTSFGEVSKNITGALALSFEVSYQDLHDLTLSLNLESI